MPFICYPLTSQPISLSGETYEHLIDLELVDSADMNDVLQVDVLVGSDLYWTLVTGEVRRGPSGPMDIRTRIGWILSGPVDAKETNANLTLTNTHTHTHTHTHLMWMSIQQIKVIA